MISDPVMVLLKSALVMIGFLSLGLAVIRFGVSRETLTVAPGEDVAPVVLPPATSGEDALIVSGCVRAWSRFDVA